MQKRIEEEPTTGSGEVSKQASVPIWDWLRGKVQRIRPFSNRATPLTPNVPTLLNKTTDEEEFVYSGTEPEISRQIKKRVKAMQERSRMQLLHWNSTRNDDLASEARCRREIIEETITGHLAIAELRKDPQAYLAGCVAEYTDKAQRNQARFNSSCEVDLNDPVMNLRLAQRFELEIRRRFNSLP